MKNDRGFSLIEVLVVISILGILAAIITFASSRYINRAREVEALTFINAVNKSQQIHYTEQNQFAATLEAIGVNVDGTPYYRYEVATKEQSATIKADANSAMLPGMTGVVWVDKSVIKSKFCKGVWWSAPACPPEFERDDGGR